ncbi:hypothetical protein FACS1894123_02720 [Bacteroidia bacterium]|nr:hypothetical protein FACS1894123_02720 [Bacteroidia bacterium]
MKHSRLTTMFLLLSCALFAQEKQRSPFALSGSIQSDILFPQEDATIGASPYETSVLTNTYADLNMYNARTSDGALTLFLTAYFDKKENVSSGIRTRYIPL